jgi:hypothetical protein
MVLVATFTDPSGNFLSSTSSPYIQDISKASPTLIASTTQDPVAVGQPIDINATLSNSPGILGGTISFSSDIDGVLMGSPIGAALGLNTLSNVTLSGPDIHNITVTYSGDANNNGTVYVYNNQVVQAATSTNATRTPSGTITFGNPVTLTANVTASAGGPPTGTVSFFSSLDGFINSDNVIGGTAQVVTSTLTVGTHEITASYVPDTIIYLDSNDTLDAPIEVIPCVSANTLVRTNRGIRKIKDIKTGDLVLTHNGKYTNVLYNLKFLPTTDYIKISEGSLGDHKPKQSLYIRKGHPLFIDGKEIECQNLINDKTIYKVTLDKPIRAYSLCTPERTFVYMNNLPVCTWSDEGWKEEIAKYPMIKWEKQ